jgi:hypothetical protein
MNSGDRVRILAGRGAGHVGIVEMHNGSSVNVSVPTLCGMAAGKATLSIRRRDLEVIRAVTTDVRVANFRPYVPPQLSVPRAGSDLPSRLPSLAGNQLVYPRGLR